MHQPPRWQSPRILLLVALFGTTLVGLALVGFALFNNLTNTPETAALEPALPNSSGMLPGTDPFQLSAQAPLDDSPLATPSPTPGAVIVYISGAVVHPDVYQLPHSARVKDVIVAAGGLTSDADVEQMNLAAYIEDAQHIYVPRKGELSAGLGEAQPLRQPSDQANTQVGASQLVDLNTAGQSELEELPGVGSVTAQRIVEHRTINGPFTTVEDLRHVSGIGPALYDTLKTLVTVE